MQHDNEGSRASLYTHIARPLSLTYKALALLLLLGALLTGFAPIPVWAQVEPVCTPPPSGMVSWWPGDGAANDLIGTNHGTLVNETTFAPGMVGQAFSFDGVDDYVNVPHSAGLDVTTALTLDAWIKPAGAGTGNGIIIMKNPLKYALVWFPGTQKITFSLDIGGWADHLSNNVVPVDQWSHVAGTYDGSNVKIYINGVLDAVFPRTGLIATSTGDLTIGRRTDSPEELFNGLIDEVEVFDRVLSASEIQSIYNAGSAGKCKSCAAPPAGMVSWWDAEGDANDLIGTNDGTLVNGATFASGMVGQAFSFDGVDDHVNVGNASSLKSAQFTLDAWVKATAFPRHYNTVISHGFTAGMVNPYFLGFASNGALYFITYHNSVGSHSTVAPGSITANEWHHIAGTFDGTTKKLYIDGGLVASDTVSDAIVYDSTSVLIGEDTDWGAPAGIPFSGLIDEVEIFDRALTAAEIQAIYNAGSAGKCTSCAPPPSEMVSWWKGEGDANDLIGTNHGTLVNSATFVPGMVGQAFSFSGVDDYVEIPDSASLNPSGAFSVDGWFYIDPSAPSNAGEIATLVAKTEGSTGNGWALYFDDRFASKSLKFVIGSVLEAVNAIPTANWYHITAVFDPLATPNATLYVNGAVVASVNTTGATANALNVRIGAMYWTDFYAQGNDRLNGLADEVEFFDRALTAEEVASLYQAGSFGKCESVAAYTLNVEINPAGGGTVTATGIACPGDCTEVYNAGDPVALTAAANSGYRFDSWTNCDAPSGNQCVMTMNADKTVIANFIRQYTLTVVINGTGTGTVSGSGIACPGDCTEVYDANTPVVLNPAANSDSVLSGWSVDCPGGALTMDADKSCTATFNLANGPDLTGDWNPVTQICRRGRCTLRGSMEVRNQGNATAPTSRLRVILSTNAVLGDPDDVVLRESDIGQLRPGQSRTRPVNVPLPTGVSAVGKYLFAVIDALNSVVETLETNNAPMYGPIP